MDIEWEAATEKHVNLATSAMPLNNVGRLVWVALCFPKSPFARDKLSPFELALDVEKQYEFE